MTKEKEHKIGDIGPGGGIIFYDKGEFFIGSGKANTIKIISAIGDDYIVYGVETPEVAIRDYNYAAKACSFANKECIHTRIHDWFLPSKDELNLMYEFFKNKTFGSFEKEWYWSSSEKDEEKAWQQNFRTGEQSVCRRTAISRVRPIRAF